MDIAPVAQKPAPAPAAPVTTESAMAEYQKAIPAAQAEADMSIDERMAEQQRLEDKYLGKDTGAADYRKAIMEEKANAPDEARRQMGLRLMEFGANWAGTPGPPLVAGMRALKDTLPAVMEDNKENKKVMKEIDKSIYMLEHATRLEEAGKLEKAAVEKEKASAKVLALKEPLVNFAMKKQELDATIEHQRAVESLQRQQLSQSAQQHRDTLAADAAKPTSAGMQAQAIKDLMATKGLSYAEAWKQTEPVGAGAKDPRLALEIGIAKTRYAEASQAASAALTPEAKDRANTELSIAAENLTRLQNSISSIGEYDGQPVPSPGPRGSSDQTIKDRIPLSSFQK